MSAACFGCAGPAEERYVVVFASGAIYPENPLCAACAADLRGTDRIELSAEPMLLRGGKARVKECPECGREIAVQHWPRHLRTCSGDSEAHT